MLDIDVVPLEEEEMATEPVQKKIMEALGNSPKTIVELAKATGIHRVTISKHASIMEAAGIVSHKTVGKAKIYSLKSGKKEKVTKTAKSEKPREELEPLVRKLTARELAKRKIVPMDEAVEIAGMPASEFKAFLAGDIGRRRRHG
ncbi:Bacterial regulatory protein, arsR family [Candidatus Norongarragalina meridionalis]|nr:Bacterial regulatory protein, arsR family [Candidatus Norongarragalina meridionalis]